MAMLAPKVMAIFTMMLLMGVTAQAAPVSFGNFLHPLTDLQVHCRKDAQKALTRTISPWKEYAMSIPMGFYGTFICDFTSAGRRTTTFDVFNSECNCNNYYGCAWVVKSDGFYCDFNFIYNWA